MRYQRIYTKIEAVGHSLEGGKRLQISITTEKISEPTDAKEALILEAQKEMIKIVEQIEKVIVIDYDLSKASATLQNGKTERVRLDDAKEVEITDEPKKETKSPFLDMLGGL